MTEDVAPCVLCGRQVVAGDARANVQPLPGYIPPPMHRDCWATELERSRARQRAWSRSLRGRISLASVTLKLGFTVAGGVFVWLVAAGPVALWHGFRGWHLRRAIRETLGANRGLVLAKFRHRTDAESLGSMFPDVWAASLRVLVRVVDSGDAAACSLDDAAWQHWRPPAKLSVNSGVVFVPLTGRVRQWSLDARDARGGTLDSRAAGVRMDIETLLGR
jgi:hypothetical protein